MKRGGIAIVAAYVKGRDLRENRKLIRLTD
jgi:hypothetical protein